MICLRAPFRSDVASFFEPSVNCIVDAIAEQSQKARKPIKVGLDYVTLGCLHVTITSVGVSCWRVRSQRLALCRAEGSLQPDGSGCPPSG